MSFSIFGVVDVVPELILCMEVYCCQIRSVACIKNFIKKHFLKCWRRSKGNCKDKFYAGTKLEILERSGRGLQYFHLKYLLTHEGESHIFRLELCWETGGRSTGI